MSPRNAAEIGGTRYYTVPGVDHPLPSVTSVLKVAWPKTWLGAYAAKHVALEAVEGVRAFGEDALEEWEVRAREEHEATVTHQTRHKRTCPFVATPEAYLKAAPWKRRDKAADFGTIAHELLEAWAKDRPAAVPEGHEGHAAALREWFLTYRPRVIASEFQCANVTYGYAGSGDLIAEVYGRTWLIDLKTADPSEGEAQPSTGHRAEWRLQLAAYRHAEFLFDGDARVGDMPKVEGCAVLWIPKSNPGGWMFIEVGASAPEFLVFQHGLAVYHYHEANKASDVEARLILPQAIEESAA